MGDVVSISASPAPLFHPCSCDKHRCGNNYGWSRFEGSRCQEAQEGRDGPCLGADRSQYTFPWFEYCHPGYKSNVDSEAEFLGGVDLCGDRLITGNTVIGEYMCLHNLICAWRAVRFPCREVAHKRHGPSRCSRCLRCEGKASCVRDIAATTGPYRQRVSGTSCVRYVCERPRNRL